MTYRTNPNAPDTQRPMDLDVQVLRLDLLPTDAPGTPHAADVAITVDPLTRLIVDCSVLTHAHGLLHREAGTGSVGLPEAG